MYIEHRCTQFSTFVTKLNICQMDRQTDMQVKWNKGPFLLFNRGPLALYSLSLSYELYSSLFCLLLGQRPVTKCPISWTRWPLIPFWYCGQTEKSKSKCRLLLEYRRKNTLTSPFSTEYRI